MQTETSNIFEEYNKAKRKKEALGEKGLYEQIKINERFYSGNQWYGANCGNDRPLVRHNIIKRIGDFKISQTLLEKHSADFFVNNPDLLYGGEDYESLKEKIKKGNFSFSGQVTENEISAVCGALSYHYKQTAERLNLSTLCAKTLRQAYITGSGILYTYFNGETKAGFNSFGTEIKGDIACEVLNIRDVYFADITEPDVQSQPYIIIASNKERDALLIQAKQFGTEEAVLNTKADEDGKILVLTKLYKTYVGGTPQVRCIKVTEGGVLRPDFDTKLHLYPLAVFRFCDNGESAYGESEIPYLIPNQIAINRMITASVWSNLASGMPMMVVNGDTVSGEISNQPGQIVKIYGSNEDVSGAIKFVSPDDISEPFNSAINNLIENTLTQSGATQAALGDEHAQNASAITRLQAAAVLPLNLLKSEYKALIFSNALIWADFWFSLYGNRRLRIEDESGVWYFPFNAERYRQIDFCVSVQNTKEEVFSSDKIIETLGSLYDRGVITKAQYLLRLPDSLVPEKGELLSNIKENENETE